MLFIKNNKLRIINWFLLTFTTFITTVWINLYYIAPRNVDFNKYYDYINYFLGADVEIKYGQGSLYYFLISIAFKRNALFADHKSLEIILNYAIQNINLIFYLIGLYGLYKFLKFLGFEENLIFLSLCLLNFFPQAIYMRAVMKPEIIAFSFFPWVLYFIEKYKNDKNILNLYYAMPFLLLIFISKGSVGSMAFVYLLITYYPLAKKIQIKKLLILILISLSLFSFLQYENYLITGNNLFEREYEEEYDNRAKLSSVFNLNIKKVFTDQKFTYSNTEINVHADSILNISILDSFGDYFNQLFNDDVNYFSQNRKDLFRSEGSLLFNSDRQILYKGPLSSVLDTNLDVIRRALSSLISIIFYFYLTYLIYKDKKNRKFYIMPLVGMAMLFINSLGIPSNNYNPNLGDTYKTFYYSFLISITFLFVMLKILKHLKDLKILFVLLWIITILFIAGHPKGVSQEHSDYLVTRNEHSLLCSINNIVFFENKLIKMIHPSGIEGEFRPDCFKSIPNFPLDDESKRDTEFCFDSNEKINKTTSSFPGCRLVILDYLFTSEEKMPIKYPLIPIFLLFFIFTIVFNDSKFKTKITN